MTAYVLLAVGVAAIVLGVFGIVRGAPAWRYERTLANIARLEQELGMAGPVKSEVQLRWETKVANGGLSVRQARDVHRRGLISDEELRAALRNGGWRG